MGVSCGWWGLCGRWGFVWLVRFRVVGEVSCGRWGFVW